MAPVPVVSDAGEGASPLAVEHTPRRNAAWSLIRRLVGEDRLILCPRGKAYLIVRDAPNVYAVRIGSRAADAIVGEAIAAELGFNPRKRDLGEFNEHLQSAAARSGIVKSVWCRVAPDTTGSGIVIDLGDEKHTRVRVTPGRVETITVGCGVLFYRTPITKPMCVPAAEGDLSLLYRYLGNLHAALRLLLVAWLAYTLAHPKVPTTNFVILVLIGGEGTGKSTLTKRIKALIDPSVVVLQVMPSGAKDLAIAAQSEHVACYDNLRSFSQSMADTLCIAATGGALSSRQLYTDGDQHVLHLHIAIVLNGIHDFVTQPDLAQRCLPLHLTPFSESDRRPEAEVAAEFERDRPRILCGLLDLIAKIFVHLPSVTVESPERMIEFCRWLAAMELAMGMPPGVLQQEYSAVLKIGQRESLLSSPLAAAVLEFAEREIDGTWSGTPAELLFDLNAFTPKDTQRSRGWPLNPVSLSKRLVAMQAALLSQGIRLELHRGKYRTISIAKVRS